MTSHVFVIVLDLTVNLNVPWRCHGSQESSILIISAGRTLAGYIASLDNIYWPESLRQRLHAKPRDTVNGPNRRVKPVVDESKMIRDI
jgi:hypothetical protein